MRKITAFTLIELIIVIAIMGFVIAAGFSVLLFGNNVFNKGSSQAEIQSDLRIASDAVKNELRYATEVTLLAAQETPVATYSYLYISGNRLIQATTDGSGNVTTRNLTEAVLTNVAAPFSLIVDANGVNFLNMVLESQSGDQAFNVTTEIILKNIKDLPASTNFVVKYK